MRIKNCKNIKIARITFVDAMRYDDTFWKKDRYRKKDRKKKKRNEKVKRSDEYFFLKISIENKKEKKKGNFV